MKIKTKINLAIIVVALVSIASSVTACPVCPCEALYENEWWGDLSPAVQDAYSDLGYNEAMWNGGQLAPSYYLFWEQLSAAEKEAARFLGYTKQSWNQCETFEGRNLRGYDAAVSNDAVSLNLEGGGIICPDGRTAITNTFCGRGPARRDCDEGQFCYVHPTDAFAVCCSDPTSTSGAEVAD